MLLVFFFKLIRKIGKIVYFAICLLENENPKTKINFNREFFVIWLFSLDLHSGVLKSTQEYGCMDLSRLELPTSFQLHF